MKHIAITVVLTACTASALAETNYCHDPAATTKNAVDAEAKVCAWNGKSGIEDMTQLIEMAQAVVIRYVR